MNIAFT